MSEIEFEKELVAHETDIPGLIWYDLPVHGDSRGWFKENWQREKMLTLGLPDFGPVQNNISFNQKRGVTRGLHAEPWDKYISIGTGRIFGAWVDLREGNTFGKVFTLEMDPSKAIFVPRGVANAYQALDDGTAYTYLVNDHWSANNREYAFLNLADPHSHIQWPISLHNAEISDKDRLHPELDNVKAIPPRKILITGANGQLGKSLRLEFSNAEFTDHALFDVTRPETWDTRNWHQYSTIINAAAYTDVDSAETSLGRVQAWRVNAMGAKNLAVVAKANNITLVNISSDYVFDGTQPNHNEDEPLSPLSVYGASKAAGDIATQSAPYHYIIRTSWMIGDGKNFVQTMKSLAERDAKISVVDDQIGRLTFATDVARAIKHLIDTRAPFGTYNITSDGPSASWGSIAKRIFSLLGKSEDNVTLIDTKSYNADKGLSTPRPRYSTLSLEKVKATGFVPCDGDKALSEYLVGQ